MGQTRGLTSRGPPIPGWLTSRGGQLHSGQLHSGQSRVLSPRGYRAAAGHRKPAPRYRGQPATSGIGRNCAAVGSLPAATGVANDGLG
jgi:hypothetical protein